MTRITVRIPSNFQSVSTRINLDGKEYLIDSENLGAQNPEIITRIFHKGKIVHSCKAGYKDILNHPDLDKKLVELTERQQHIAIEAFKKETRIQNGTYKEYITEIETLIKKNNQEKALQVLTDALKNYPNNPIILSYQGCLEAIVNRKYSKGVSNCIQALKVIKEQVSFNKAYYLSILYLNLGRAYLAADKRKEAYDSFKKGLETGNIHEGLIWELEKLGLRRNPPFPSLKRSNPLNKYIGKLIYRTKSKIISPTNSW